MLMLCCGLSEIVDVFSILPAADQGTANGSGKGRPRTPDTSTEGYKPSPISLKQYRVDDEEPLPQERAYRSVRKAPIRTKSAGSQNEDNLEAAKAIMG